MKMLREPLVQFLVLGVLLVAAHRVISAVSPEEIVITGDQVDAVAEAIQRDDLDRETIARGLLRDEVLYREGIRRGLGEEPMVREVVIRQLRKELEPVLPEPTDEELRALREQLPDRYDQPAKISFEHVSFPDRGSVDPADLLERLRAGEDFRGFGQAVRLANPLPPTFATQLERVLGKTASDEIFAMEPGRWSGPVASDRGVHFVKVLAKQEGGPIPFEQVRPTLAAIWLKQRTDAEVDRQVDEMAGDYRVVLPKEGR